MFSMANKNQAEDSIFLEKKCPWYNTMSQRHRKQVTTFLLSDCSLEPAYVPCYNITDNNIRRRYFEQLTIDYLTS